MNILVTGGAGFVGTHLSKALAKSGHNVRILDVFLEHIHGKVNFVEETDKWQKLGVDLHPFRIKNKSELKYALQDIEVIYHLASKVGVGQSQYDMFDYYDINVNDTAILMDTIVKERFPIKQIILASSVSTYGEGPYHNTYKRPLPVTEKTLRKPGNVYAMTKYMQEEMLRLFCRTYGIKFTALRYLNIYGLGQSLRNPYTGVISIFLNRLLNGKAPTIYEDGLQTRDFVNVVDIVRANIKALEFEKDFPDAFNIGSGRFISILNVAKIVAQKLGVDIEPNVTHKIRNGDIRFCYASIDLAKAYLGYQSTVKFEDGIDDLIGKEKEKFEVTDIVEQQLQQYGLVE